MDLKFVFVAILICISVPPGNCWSKFIEKILQGVLAPPKTTGAVWPKPQEISQDETYLTLDSQTFEFVYTGLSCDIVDAAIARYTTVIFNPPRLSCTAKHPPRTSNNLQGALPALEINISGECESWPYLNMDESCKVYN